jgi:hypothetical protein
MAERSWHCICEGRVELMDGPRTKVALGIASMIAVALLVAGCGATASPATAPTDDRFATSPTAASTTAPTAPSTDTPTSVSTVTPAPSSTLTSTTTPSGTSTLPATSTATATSTVTVTPTSPPTATPALATSTATPGSSGSAKVVTLADDGQTIELATGSTFLLQLGETWNWTVTIADPTVVHRLVNIAVIRGAQGVYVAAKSGQTTLTAVGDPFCRSAQPPCAMPSRVFRATIVVH